MAFTTKSIIIDVADNYGDGSFTAIRAVDLYDSSGKVALTSANTSCYGSYRQSGFEAWRAFDTALSKIGGEQNTSWMDNTTCSARIICVLNTQIELTGVRINNSHYTGGYTTRGAQNVKIHISTDSISDTTYNAAIANSTKIYDSTFDQHATSDAEDEQTLELLSSDIIVANCIITASSNISATPSSFKNIITNCIITASSNISATPSIVVQNSILSATGGLSISSAMAVKIITDCILSATSGMDASPYLSIPSVQLSGQARIDADAYLSLANMILSGTGGMDGSARTFEIDTTNLAINFYCIITGSADGEIDLTLPISSFSARMRQGDPTYLQVVTPGLDYSEEISNRSNGQIVVRIGLINDGVILQLEEIIRVDLETIRLYEGGRNQSIVLTGHLTETYAVAEYALEDVSYKNVSNGTITIRCGLHKYIRPGCTATYDGDTFTISNISWTVNNTQRAMEVSE